MGCGASKDGAGGMAGDKPNKHSDPMVINLEGQKNDPRLKDLRFNLAIRELNISQCELEIIPEQISLLTSLLTLNASQNRLKELPPGIGQCTMLTSLDCNDNTLTTVPAAIGCLTELAKLLLYKNSISSLPEELCKCIKLEELNLFNNKVNSAAITKAAVGILTGLKEVNFAANKVMQIKENEVAGWTEVKCLNWYDNRIVKLAPLGHCAKLEELRLFGNQLSSAPDFGRGMPHLTILELHKNCITSLPDNFFELCPALAKVTLEQNQLQALPDGICHHKTLGSLIVHTNQLGALPGGLGTMPSLKVLFVHDNKLTALPSSLGDNKLLERVNLSGNQIVGCEAVVESLQRACTAADGMFWPPS